MVVVEVVEVVEVVGGGGGRRRSMGVDGGCKYRRACKVIAIGEAEVSRACIWQRRCPRPVEAGRE
eukprot:1024423-Pleurochrysis_carterae.AAC.1